MNRTTLRESIRLYPFKSFIVHISDGQQFKIDSPDIIAVSPTQEVAIIFTSNSYNVIDTTKITSLEVK
ncbi:MAG TPA: hypothetical protein VF849_00010 [Blattabacteriaceae bacterium]